MSLTRENNVLAEQATAGNEYFVSVYTRVQMWNIHFFEKQKTRTTCGGWNFSHTRVLFFYEPGDGRRYGYAALPSEFIQAVD